MSRLGTLRNVPGRLYRGEVSVDFVSRKRLWYTISGAILLISILGLGIRGLNFSVEFKGGSLFNVPASQSVNQTSLVAVVSQHGGINPTATEVKPFNGRPAIWQVQTSQLHPGQAINIENAIATKFHIPSSAVSVTSVGSSWGAQISQKALEALIAFLIVIVIYLSIAFEWTIGVYALTGFQVSPATVIGLLTILGYSLYDTVVVFDKVRENTASLLGTRKSTYSDAANLALNQTLVRSINTSLTA